MLAAVEIAGLRQLAADGLCAVLDDAARRPVDLVARVACVVPVDVLVAVLGMPPVPTGAVAAIAKAYQPGSDPGSDAEDAADQTLPRAARQREAH